MKLLLTLLSASLLLAAPAAAQQQPPARAERPYRGLFGGGVGETEQLLTLNVSLGGGYDDNVLADSIGGGGVADPRQPAQGGQFGSLSGQATYTLNRTRVGMTASAGTSARYYAELSDDFVASHSGSVGAFVQVAKATRLTASHTTAYQPFLTLGLFPQLFDVPGQVVPARPELGVGRSDYMTHSSGIDLSQELSRRASVSVNYRQQWSDFRSEDRKYSNRTGGARFSLGLARGLGMHAGYGYTEANYAAGGDAILGHNIDVGLDFNRALSFSRRTTLSFGTGSSAIADGQRTHFRLTGQARLNREIGRTWNASGAYVRSAGFVESLPGPVFSDAATVACGGLINRRLEFRSALSASAGEFATGNDGNSFRTYTGSAGLSYALTRHLGLSVNYSYYRYSFDPTALVLAGFAPELDRQSVQASLSLWAPLIHRARRPDAAR